MGKQNGGRASVLLLIVFVWGGVDAQAQSWTSALSASSDSQTHFCAHGPSGGSLDARGLALVYCTSHPGVTVPLQGAHVTARPLFFGAAPAAWLGAGLSQSRSAVAAAYRLTLTQALTSGLVLGAKHVVRRPRPYVHRPLKARAERHDPPSPGDAYLSFPSGHASLSAALATSWSLSYPRWYVIGPGALWATGVALSRVHLGVHYPSDILAGAALGVGVALLVHQLRRSITPSPLRAQAGAQRLRAPPLVVRIQF